MMKVDYIGKEISNRRGELHGLCNARAVPFLGFFKRVALTASARTLIASGMYSDYKKYSTNRLVDCKCGNDICITENYLLGYVGDYMYEVSVDALKCRACGKLHEIDEQSDVIIEYSPDLFRKI